MFSLSVFLTAFLLGIWTVGHSGPLSRSPSLSFSSLILTVLHRSSTDPPKILLPPSLTTWYLDSRSFWPTLQFSKSLLFLPNPHRSLQIFHRFSKILLPPSLSLFTLFLFHSLIFTTVTYRSLAKLRIHHLLRSLPPQSFQMEDPNQVPKTTPVENNLIRINTAFQDSCLPLLLTTTHSCMILCDFPSRILNPPPNISIFSLDDFSLFLNTALAHPERCVYVLTQQTLTLRKLLSMPSPLPMPFWYLTRTSSTAPLELKIIEIFHSLPIGLQDRISQLYFISTFSAMLNGKKIFSIFYLIHVTSPPSFKFLLPPFFTRHHVQ